MSSEKKILLAIAIVINMGNVFFFRGGGGLVTEGACGNGFYVAYHFNWLSTGGLKHILTYT